MSLEGHLLLLPQRSADARFTSITRHWLTRGRDVERYAVVGPGYATQRLQRLSRKAALNVFDCESLDKSESPMATTNQFKAAIIARTRRKDGEENARGGSLGSTPLPIWSGARDRVEAAERRIANNHTSNPNRAHAGLRRAQLELHVIESQLRLRGLLE
jgi:hypothetical protein